MLKFIMTRAALIACLCSLSLSAHAVADDVRRHAINIPPENLSLALEQLSKQSGTDLVYRPEQVRGFSTHGLVGQYSAQEAVTKLLTGTPLTFSIDPSGALLIAAPLSTASGAQSSPGTPAGQPPDQPRSSLQLAQATPGQTSGPSTVVQQNESAHEKPVESDEHMPEVLIKGSRVMNVDVKRTEDDVQPYYIFDSEQLQQSGASNVEDFLKQQLTMNTNVQSNNQAFGQTLGNTSTINLRGLGSNETLILIDGRRTAGISLFGGTNQPDINGIPVSAIERIEVLPSSASAIYGGAAMGGVVNIILKKNYEGGDIGYTFENTTNGSAPINKVNATYGFSLWEGKTKVMLTGQYSDGSVLQLRDRMDLVDQGYSAILRNDPSFFLSNPSAPIVGATTNIGSFDGVTNLTLKGTGTPLNSPIATLAHGTTAATPSTIIPGQWNTDLVPTTESNGLLIPLGVAPRVKSLLASVRQEVTSALELFAEFSTISNIGTTSYNPFNTNGGVLVPATSPANPFNQDVNVAFPNTVSTQLQTDSVTQSVTGGFLLSLPADWKSELDYTWSRNAFEYSFDTYDSIAFGSALANGSLNPFVDTLANPLNLSPYLAPSSWSGASTLNDLGLRLSGPLWSLPWGTPSVTIGLEHRKEGNQNSNQITRYPLTPANNLDEVFFGQSQSTDSVYVEAQVPLVTEKNAVPLVRSLELQLAGRSERYTVHFGTSQATITPVALRVDDPPQGVHQTLNYTSTNPTIGLKYKPVEDMTFRMSYAQAFLPPIASQFLFDPIPSSYTVPITDPKNGQTYGVQLLCCGNPHLKPQNSRDWDLGIIFEPQEDFLRGLRVDLEHYQITQPNFITTPDPQSVVSDPALASRVTRNPATGLITTVDIGFLNALNYKTEGWDLTLNYRKPTSIGTFELQSVGTLIEHDKRQYTLGGPNADYVGYPSEGGEAKIKANITLRWEYKNVAVAWTTLYYGSYQQFGSPGGPFAQQNGPYTYYTNAQGGDTIPSQIYHQIAGTYVLPLRQLGPVSNVKVQAGIKNLFNKVPPFDAYYSPYYYSPYGDPRLRDYWLGISASF